MKDWVVVMKIRDIHVRPLPTQEATQSKSSVSLLKMQPKLHQVRYFTETFEKGIAQDGYEGTTKKENEIVILCVGSQPALGIKFILEVQEDIQAKFFLESPSQNSPRGQNRGQGQECQ